jgi:hypothetical protein
VSFRGSLRAGRGVWDLGRCWVLGAALGGGGGLLDSAVVSHTSARPAHTRAQQRRGKVVVVLACSSVAGGRGLVKVGAHGLGDTGCCGSRYGSQHRD